MQDQPDGEEAEDPGAPGSFEATVVSVRRWILILGVVGVAGLAALAFDRSVLAGFCVGWLLALFTLDHLASNSRAVMRQGVSPRDAQARAVRTYVRRWAVVIVGLAVAHRLGANLVAALLGLLLLQAAIMCRSIALLSEVRGLWPTSKEPPPAEDKED